MMFAAATASAMLTPIGPARAQAGKLALATCRPPGVPVDIRCGTFWVREDRTHADGRRIPLYVRLIPATTDRPAPDALVFVSPGGPGTTNSDVVAFAYARGWQSRRDVVIVDLRGTSGPDRLDCPLGNGPAASLSNSFDSVAVARCRSQLQRRADLRQYTTANVVDDLNDALDALGYRTVDLWGASGGTRVVLEFIRQHGASVRAAIVEGTAPVSFKNPLPHAQAAQEALDSLAAQCARDRACRAAYPHWRAEFDALHHSLTQRPVTTRMPPSLGGTDSVVTISWPMFAEIIRTMSYSVSGGRQIPSVVHRAAAGDFAPAIENGVVAGRRTHAAIRFGFLLSQTCTEDVPRITEAEIAEQTRGTYLGDFRVRAQRAACATWPKGATSPADFSPVRSTVPVFLLSGTIDPVTRPRFAAEAARTLPNSIHVIAPGGHVPSGPCVAAMERQFLAGANPKAVDTSCVLEMSLPPFAIEPR